MNNENEQIDYLLTVLKDKNKKFDNDEIKEIIKKIIINDKISINIVKNRIINNNFYKDENLDIKSDLIDLMIDNKYWNKKTFTNDINKNKEIEIIDSNDNELILKINNFKDLKNLKLNYIDIINDEKIFNNYKKDSDDFYIKLDFNKDIKSENSMFFSIISKANKHKITFNGHEKNVEQEFKIKLNKEKLKDYIIKLNNNEKLIFACENNLCELFDDVIKNEKVYISDNNNSAIKTAIENSSYEIVDKIIKFKKNNINDINDSIYNLIKNKEDSMNISFIGKNEEIINMCLNKNDNNKMLYKLLDEDFILLNINKEWLKVNLSENDFKFFNKKINNINKRLF